MKISNPILFDTNVLLYNQSQDSPQYQLARSWHKLALNHHLNAIIAQQNVTEFVAVITNPKQIPKPLTPSQALSEIDSYINSQAFTFISPNLATLKIFLKLTKTHPPKNPQHIFDIYLVATMLSNQINTILTHNIKDFTHFKQLKVIPLSQLP